MQKFMCITDELDGRQWCRENGYKYCGTRIHPDYGYVMEYEDDSSILKTNTGCSIFDSDFDYIREQERKREQRELESEEYKRLQDENRRQRELESEQYKRLQDEKRKQRELDSEEYKRLQDEKRKQRELDSEEYKRLQNEKRKQRELDSEKYRNLQENKETLRLLRNGQYCFNATELEEKKDWVVISEDGYTGRMFVGTYNRYVFSITEAKRFTKQEAQKKSIMMTKNSKSNRIWKPLKI